MVCREMEERVNLLLDRELSDLEQEAVYAHFSNCRGCRAYFDTMLEVRLALRGHPIRPPEELDEKVFGTAGVHRPRGYRSIWGIHVPVPLPVAAGILLCIAALSVLLWREEPRQAAPGQGNQSLAQSTRVEYLYVLPEVTVKSVGSSETQ